MSGLKMTTARAASRLATPAARSVVVSINDKDVNVVLDLSRLLAPIASAPTFGATLTTSRHRRFRALDARSDSSRLAARR